VVALQNGVSMTIIIQLQMIKNTVYFSDIVNAIGQAGGDVIGIESREFTRHPF
jgi:hypothetical protein